MLHIIGLGLHDEGDLSLKAFETLKKSDRIYFESYTSYFNGDLKSLAEKVGKDIICLTRKDIEENPKDNVLAEGEISLLVVGDPFVATTHTDLVLRAWEQNIRVKVIHSSSIISAVGETGLQLYKFGKTTTIGYPEGSHFPKSPYEAIKENHQRGLHTLCLLDVKSEKCEYMTVNEAIEILFRMEKDMMQNQFKPDTECVGVARLGGDSVVRYGEAEKLVKKDFGGPPHALIVVGELHFMEKEILEKFRA